MPCKLACCMLLVQVCCMLHNILLEYDGLASIGQEEGHWITMDVLNEDSVHGQEVPCDDNVAAHSSRDNVEVHPESYLLREALITHYRAKFEDNAVSWLRTAADIRALNDKLSEEEWR
eukprot:580380-Pleurochrysis_carterae.AAC.1